MISNFSEILIYAEEKQLKSEVPQNFLKKYEYLTLDCIESDGTVLF